MSERVGSIEDAHPGQSGFRLLSDGSEAFVVRMQSARLAARSLDVQTYIWHADLTGAYLAQALLEAADRGVRVRLLLDDLDARAKNAYRRRLAEIEDDIDQARATGDTERAAQADAEHDFLVRELSRAVGLGGRDRRAASASERARVAVTRAVRHAINRIGEHDLDLGEHLSHTIRTGTYCAYGPDPRAPAGWGF